MTVFVVAEGKADPIEIETDASSTVERVAELAAERLNFLKNEVLVFIEDSDEPLPFDAVVKDVAPADACFHVHRCHHIGVAVTYNTKPIAGDFRPAITIGRLREWAVSEFKLHPTDAACLRLQLQDGTFPMERAHVGQFAGRPNCGVVFRLAEHKKPQG